MRIVRKYQQGGPNNSKLVVITNPDAKHYRKTRDLTKAEAEELRRLDIHRKEIQILNNADHEGVYNPEYRNRPAGPLGNDYSKYKTFIKPYDTPSREARAQQQSIIENIYQPEYKIFEREYQRLEPTLRRLYPNISYQELYKNPEGLKKVLQSMGKYDQLAIMDHVGDDMLGIPMDELSQIFKEYYPKDNKNPCLWGSCHGNTIIPRFTEISGIRSIGTNNQKWKGGNPKGQTVEDVMFPNKRDVKEYVPIKQQGGSIEGDLISKILLNRNKNLNFVQRLLRPEEYPEIINKDGTRSTHLMKYGTDDDGSTWMYPGLQYNPQTNSLEQGNGHEAIQIPNNMAQYISSQGYKNAAKDLRGMQSGGNINTTGYTPGTPSYENDFNIIPSNVLTMKDTPFNILGIPNKGKPKVMLAGLRKIVFPGAKYVTEIPLKAKLGLLLNSYS